jgi:hypothetical protein
MSRAMTHTDHVNEELIHCDAFNHAFYELGMRWHWDLDTYQQLQPDAEDAAARIRAYLEAEQPHILKAYNPDFLVKAILETKNRCLENRLSCGNRLPGAVNWAAFEAAEIGV